MFTRIHSTSSMSRRAGVAAASFAAFALLATACSDSKKVSGSDATTSSSSTSVAATSTTVAPATTVVETSTTAAPTTVAPTVAPTTAAPLPVCAESTAPSESAIGVNVIDGDWNGDGVGDQAVSWAEDSGSGPVWFVRAEVNGGASSSVTLGDLGVGFAEVLDRVDVDFSLGAPEGTNRDEILAVVGSNAAGYNLGVFGVGADGCVFRFDDGGGAPYEIPIHGAAATVSGLICDGGAGSQFMVRLEAETDDGTNWTTLDTKIERTGATSLGDGVSIPGAVLVSDAAFLRYANAECFGDPYF